MNYLRYLSKLFSINLLGESIFNLSRIVGELTHWRTQCEIFPRFYSSYSIRKHRARVSSVIPLEFIDRGIYYFTQNRKNITDKLNQNKKQNEKSRKNDKRRIFDQ